MADSVSPVSLCAKSRASSSLVRPSFDAHKPVSHSRVTYLRITTRIRSIAPTRRPQIRLEEGRSATLLASRFTTPLLLLAPLLGARSYYTSTMDNISQEAVHQATTNGVQVPSSFQELIHRAASSGPGFKVDPASIDIIHDPADFFNQLLVRLMLRRPCCSPIIQSDSRTGLSLHHRVVYRQRTGESCCHRCI